MMREELRRGEKGEMSESAIVRRCDSMQVEKHGRAFESIARRYDSAMVRWCEGANNKQRTTNNEQRTTNNKQQTRNQYLLRNESG
jgi:hypothetical protein